MRADLPILAALFVGCGGTALAAPNNPPNLTITSERYRDPTTYLVSGTVSDESPGVTLAYRVKGEQTEVRLNSRKNWKLRIKLRHVRTRLVFFAIDREGRRSSRQKRVLVQQSPQDQQQDQQSQ